MSWRDSLFNILQNCEKKRADAVIYLVMFAMTSGLLFLSGFCKGALKFALIVIALTLPCLLAGFRDETIGTDILSYAKAQCEHAEKMSLTGFMVNESGTSAPLWNLMTWLSTRVTGGMAGYLFTIELFCLIPVYFACSRIMRGEEWYGVLLWLLLWYAFSLNGMRQSIAMSFVLLAVTFIFERKPMPFCILVGIGMLFHQTAVVAFFMYPLALFLAYNNNTKSFTECSPLAFKVALILCAILLLFVFGDYIVAALSRLKESYSYQLNHLGERDISYAGLYMLFVICSVWCAAHKSFDIRIDATRHEPEKAEGFHKNSSNMSLVNIRFRFEFLCIASAAGCLLWQLNYIAATLGRVGYYGCSLLVLLGEAVFCLKNRRTRFVSFVLLILAIVYFVGTTMILHGEGVYPYTSQIMGII